ncbi:MAG: MlaE family ABC transporter permease [Maritimibacter sp.]
MTGLSPVAALAVVGRWGLSVLAAIGRFTLFFVRAFAALPGAVIYPRETGRALMAIGWRPLPLIGMTLGFTGAALALQVHAGSSRIAAESLVPQLVAVGILRELGPVMVGLMIVARVTASIAAELATMTVRGEVETLHTLTAPPMRYLVAPRLVAALLVAPMLLFLGDTLGLMGGFLMATLVLDFAPEPYVLESWGFLTTADLVSSLVKGEVFAVLAVVMGCFYGLHATGGARGVGRAVRGAVQSAALMILAVNVLITLVLFAS